MDYTTLTWTAFVDDHAGRALLVRNEAARHWEAANQLAVESESVSVWVDSEGVPVVAEVRLELPSDELGAAERLERLLGGVLGPVSLGSPTLWGLVPGWVWFGVTSEWPPLSQEERELEAQSSLDEAVDGAHRNSQRGRAR